MVRISRRKLLTTGIGFLLVTSLIMPATTIAVPNQSPSSNGAPLPSIAPVETSSVAPEVMSQQSISGAIDAGTNLGDYLPSDMAKLKANLNSNGRNNPNVPAADTVDNGRALNNTEGIPTADAPALAASTWQSFAYTGWFPPDPTVAAGPSNIVASVNGGIRAFTKSGTQQWGYTLANFFPAAAICGSSTCSTSGWSVFDPWITYDNIGGRFVIVALTRNTSLQQARLIVAASKSNYPSLGPSSFWIYSWNSTLYGSSTSGDWADYEKAATTSNAIIITMNMFSWAGYFQKVKIQTLWKSQIYSGANASGWNNWDLAGSPFTIQPANSSATGNVAYLLNSSSSSGSTVAFRTMTVSNTVGTAPTISSPINVSTASYSAPPDAQQPGTATLLDTGDSRLLQVVRTNAGIFAVHSTACIIESVTRSCLRFYQFNTSGSRIQQITYGFSGGSYVSYPGIAANDSGSLVIPFQYSNSSTYMSSAYTGRNSAATLSTLQSSALLGSAGQGCYIKLDNSGRNRQGDYSGASWDKSLNRFVIMGERSMGTSLTCTNNSWETRIGVTVSP